jgi:hypothetical protein
MKILGWIHVVLGLLAIGSGAIVLRGVLRVALSCNRVVWFLRYSLIASLSGLLPLPRHLPSIQEICMMMTVYCSAAVVLAWRKFGLAGLWRPVFALSLVAVLYLNVVSVSIQLFNHSLLFAMTATESGSYFEIAQFFFASVFVVLGALSIRICHAQRVWPPPQIP